MKSWLHLKGWIPHRFPGFRVGWDDGISTMFWVVCLAFWAGARAGGEDMFENPPIHYSTTVPADPVAKLAQGWTSGPASIRLRGRALLDRVLSDLKISPHSQLLVFSKTSLQLRLISPANPRALYFSDTVYIGWVPGGDLEVASMDPQLGPVFYLLEGSETGAEKPIRLTRDSDCLRCHGGTFVRDVPAVFERSLPTDILGQPLLQFGGQVIHESTPMADRWGGWYVTGLPLDLSHRGNVFAADAGQSTGFHAPQGTNLASLAKLVDLSRYPAESSDIAAHLVFLHQLDFHNAVTRANHHVRRMLAYQRGIQKELREEVTDQPVYESVKRALASSTEELIHALLMKDACPLPGGIVAKPEFLAEYTSRSPRTKDGRSLHDLDLKSHLYRHRCSPLILSDHFRELPPILKQAVLRRLDRILEGSEDLPEGIVMRPSEKRVLRDMLRELVPGY